MNGTQEMKCDTCGSEMTVPDKVLRFICFGCSTCLFGREEWLLLLPGQKGWAPFKNLLEAEKRLDGGSE